MDLPADLLSHFDALPIDRQIEIVQKLWGRIANHEAAVAVPHWHIEELQRRAIQHREATPENSWEVVRKGSPRRFDRRQ